MKETKATHTGAATLHDLLGGALPGRIHLLAGGPGSGKTSACLHFLRAGMLRGERTVLVTLDRPSDLQSHAKLLGHDLRGSVRDGRMTILRYDARFTARIAAAASPATIVSELQQLLTLADLRQMLPGQAALRIAVDPIAPFLAEGVATGAAVAALVDWLEETKATALLTWSGELSARSDRRVEALVERAAVILDFQRRGNGLFRADVVRARHAMANTPPIDFEVRPGLGLAAVAATPTEHQREPASVAPSVLLGPLTPIDDRRRGDTDRTPPA
jgi:KaiC/GvpD/RAD55 family RecA-like ATPase